MFALLTSHARLSRSFALDGPTSEAVEAVPAGEADDGDAPGDQSVLGMSASDAAAAIRKHPATTAEIRQLCGDLQVLGRSEFKALLKWCAAPHNAALDHTLLQHTLIV